MSISKIVTGGFGNGVLNGSIKDVVTSGFSISIATGDVVGSLFVTEDNDTSEAVAILPITGYVESTEDDDISTSICTVSTELTPLSPRRNVIVARASRMVYVVK